MGSKELNCKYGLLGYLTDKELVSFLVLEKEYKNTIIAVNIQKIRDDIKKVKLPETLDLLYTLENLDYVLSMKHAELHELKDITIQVFGLLRHTLKKLEQSDDIEKSIKEIYKK